MSLLENVKSFFTNNKKQDPAELEPENKVTSFVDAPNEDGAVSVVEGGTFGQYFNLDVDTSNETDLISRYRDISRMPEVNDAIDEIVNEMLSRDNEGNIITLDLDKVEFSDSIKKKIIDEFENVLAVMKFDDRGADLVRRWYIDGRLYFHKIVNEKTINKEGIVELRYINPVTIKKVIEKKRLRNPQGVEVTQVAREYFVYDASKKTISVSLNQRKSNTFVYQPPVRAQKVTVSPEAISYVTSGLYDEDFGSVLSYLHSSLKTANQVKIMEDALIITRISRAPQRRAFYIDIGNLGKVKAEQHVKDMMTKFKNQITYDSLTGEVKDARRTLNMLEDYWIPRRDGKTTEIQTLDGDPSVGQLDDVEMFRKKLLASLKVPVARFSQDQQPGFVGLGRSSEITRDEMRFQKFVDRLRARFSSVFIDILGTQLKYKKIVTDEDWKVISKAIVFVWARDSFFVELKEAEILRERLNTLQLAEPFVGRFIPLEKVFKDILKYNEEELKLAIDSNSEWEKKQAELNTPPGG